MRLRLILSFTLIVIITIASLAIIVRLNTAQTVRTFMFRGGIAGVENLVTELESYYKQHGTWQGSEKLLYPDPIETSMRKGPGQGQGQGIGTGNNTDGLPKQHIRLLDAEGQVLFDDQSEQSSGKIDAPELEQAIPLQVDDQTVGYLLPERQLAFTAIQEQTLLSQLNSASLTAALIAGGASLILALLLAYRLLLPIRDLTQAATYMAEGDLDQRVTVRGDDELATLGQTFNTMADSLQQAEERRRSLTADIAHELRTPLAVQRAHLEALQDGIYELVPENLRPIEEQNRTLVRLVEDLRTLALADAGQLTLERVSTNFSTLVQRAVDRFSPQAGARGINIKLSPSESDLMFSLDPQRIEQILNNLLSNALRYTPEGGVIFVDLSKSDENIILSVRDTGAGIPESALPHIFERFYKADKSRSRAYSGTGLGLSIARKLAQAHGGDLTASNHPEGGAVFILRFDI
ncbi:MAG: ATP-binding protein [Chloroflexota bacterium]|nr:ATP-binding protein [Chloroflexota bacterium]